jgi:hypothetical protein
MFHPTPLVNYTDPSFSQDRTPHCNLRLQISEYELSIAIYDTFSDSFPIIERYPIQKGYAHVKPQETIARILQTHALTRLSFASVEVIVVTNTYTLVPGALFDADHAGSLHALNHPLIDSDELGWERIDAQDCYFIYTWPKAWKLVMESQFPQVKILHYAPLMAKGLLPNSLGKTAVYVHVQDFREDIVVIADGKFLLFNSFNFQSSEDFVYYILLAYDRLSLNRETIPLKLLGEVEVGSALFDSCYKYIRDVDFLERNSHSAIPKPEGETDRLAPHFYFNLLHSNDADY